MDLKIETLPVGVLETNCYLVSKGKDLALIDPGDEADKLIPAIRATGRNLRYILITHGHFDHVMALDAVAHEFQTAQIFAGDPEMIKNINQSESYFGFKVEKIRAKLTPVSEGLKIPFADSYFEVLECPGHTPRGVSYNLEGNLFSGDTLFLHAHGRVDLAESDPGMMEKSLRKIAGLPENTVVYPGHGAQTTIKDEKEFGLL